VNSVAVENRFDSPPRDMKRQARDHKSPASKLPVDTATVGMKNTRSHIPPAPPLEKAPSTKLSFGDAVKFLTEAAKFATELIKLWLLLLK
jgi:hypothetical protein